MGHGKEHTNAQCPMPQAAGRLSLSTHKGMEFPAAFNKNNQMARQSDAKTLRILLKPNRI
ncbi:MULTISPECIES: hypothetical protein [unclassified Tolypothrix]|uniref:hypothetical protein n=1 Tax=unclassified Tolypothrix TaxID=2649714 RepID=UPI0005EAC2BC|nr:MULTISPECIES: hypothetical protein [unclassified Tolypothrix]EKF05661.1 hypothetical protein FDUTEX481_00516 [Tolypothrix sp. PCC 7601]MBE9084033.1 hypothetical protein [Tolypothrix sp. LEGE 11397]UYD26533.1 hypothetical protein HGR01_35535 [Tolypothrix sp. PCC 7712]UYD31230.1 hypothetical protein HG267_18945 [Tolypothrix sp. PCC 7601]